MSAPTNRRARAVYDHFRSLAEKPTRGTNELRGAYMNGRNHIRFGSPRIKHPTNSPYYGAQKAGIDDERAAQKAKP